MAFWQDDDDNGAYFSQSQSLLPFPSQSDTILSSSQLSSQPHRQSQSQQQQYSQNNSSSFLCQNCQGTDSYWDETTDRLVCADCHYESQQATQSSSQLDYEEVLQLAAKTKSGRIVRSGKTVSSSQPSSSQQPKRLAQPLEELDRSKPLPNLEKCLLGFQTVLSHGM
jgi:protein-arginine kinase activator protein McsA